MVIRTSPEKDHALQVRSMKRLLALEPSLAQQAKLVMLGSCRHDEDRARIDALRKLVTELELQVSDHPSTMLLPQQSNID